MARDSQIPKRDAERALKVLKCERRTEPKYRRPNPFGAYLMLLIGLAVAGVIVCYVLIHKEQFSNLWLRATHPSAPPAQTQPDQ